MPNKSVQIVAIYIFGIHILPTTPTPTPAKNICQFPQDPPSEEASHILMIGPLVTPAATALLLGVDC